MQPNQFCLALLPENNHLHISLFTSITVQILAFSCMVIVSAMNVLIFTFSEKVSSNIQSLCTVSKDKQRKQKILCIRLLFLTAVNAVPIVSLLVISILPTYDLLHPTVLTVLVLFLLPFNSLLNPIMMMFKPRQFLKKLTDIKIC